jgi:hypothetical protein
MQDFERRVSVPAVDTKKAANRGGLLESRQRATLFQAEGSAVVGALNAGPAPFHPVGLALVESLEVENVSAVVTHTAGQGALDPSAIAGFGCDFEGGGIQGDNRDGDESKGGHCQRLHGFPRFCDPRQKIPIPERMLPERAEN